MKTFSLQSAHDTLRGLAHEAGEMLVSSGNNLTIAYKESDVAYDVVTNVDTAVDSFLRARLLEAFPSHLIYSEESKGTLMGEYVWTIDPIDGSSNFSRGIPHCAVVIGLLIHGVQSLGVVYNPYTNDMFSYIRGEGVWHNGAMLAQQETQQALAGSTILFTIGSRESQWEWGFPLYQALAQAGSRVRNFGASALDFAFVASRRADAVIYGGVSLVDIAPAVGMLRERGGEVIHMFDGTPAELLPTPQPVVASLNPELLEHIRALRRTN